MLIQKKQKNNNKQTNHPTFFLMLLFQGAVLIKNAKYLVDAFTPSVSAHYLGDCLGSAQSEEFGYMSGIDPSFCSPENTKHNRSLRLWLPLHLYGISAFRAALEEKILITQYFYRKILEKGFTVAVVPELTVVAVLNNINIRIYKPTPNNTC